MSDTAYRDEILKVEPTGIEPIGNAQRHGRPSGIFTLWIGANVEFATLVTGALAVGLFGLGFGSAALALVVGNLLGAVLLGALTTLGPRLGVPQLVQSRGAFGFVGNYVPAAFNFVAGVGWFAVDTVLGAFALGWLLHTSFAASLAIVAALQVIFAVFGYNWIHAFERWMAALLTVLFLAVTVYALPHVHWAAAADVKAPLWSGGSGSFILAVGVAFSYVLGWIAFSSDYSRYLPAATPPARSFWPAFWGIVLSCVWLELLGAGLATLRAVTVPTDLVTGLLPHALGVLAMVAVVVGTMSANVVNIYSASLSVLAIDTRWVRALFPRRWVAVLIVGLLGTALSLAGQHGYYGKYENFLLLLAYWVAPWSGVVLVHYFVPRRGERRGRGEVRPGGEPGEVRQGGQAGDVPWRGDGPGRGEGAERGEAPWRGDLRELYDPRRAFRPGLAAWFLGLLASAPFFNQALYVGVLARRFPGLGDVSYYVSFVVAALVYHLWRSAPARPARAVETG